MRKRHEMRDYVASSEYTINADNFDKSFTEKRNVAIHITAGDLFGSSPNVDSEKREVRRGNPSD